MIMTGPDVLGLPASPAMITAIALVAHTCALTTTATLAGLIIMSLIAHIHAAQLRFIAELQASLRSTYSLLIVLTLASIFIALFAAYLSSGSKLAPLGSSWLINADQIIPRLTIVRIAFFLSASLATGGLLIAIANYLRGTDERATIFGLRVVCGAGAVSACTRLVELWVTYAHHPSVYVPGLPVIITIGIFIAAAVVGAAILGILRPRNPLWLIVTTVFLIAGFAASSFIDLKLADAAHLVTSPTFDAATRPQPALMVIFFLCCGGALGALALILRWWCTDPMSDAGCQ